MQGIELRIKGKVQGVGFRPFVWLLANQYGLNGDVNNDGQGVLIRFVSPPSDSLLNNFYPIYKISFHHWLKLRILLSAPLIGQKQLK